MQVCVTSQPWSTIHREHWTQIDSLVLFNCGLTSRNCEELVTMLDRSKEIQELNLAQNQLNTGVQRLIQPLGNALALRKLSLAGTELPSALAIDLLPVLKNVIWLDLGNNGLDDGFVERLVQEWPSALQHLQLSYNKLTEVAGRSLAGVAEQLRSLDLSHNPMSIDFPLSVRDSLGLRGLCVTSTLRSAEMYVGWNEVDSEFFPENTLTLECVGATVTPRTVASLSHCTQMQILNLTGCFLSSAVCEIVADMPALTEVSLGHNHLDSDCLDTIMQKLAKCVALKLLDLSENAALHWDISHLLPVHSLETVILTGTVLPKGLITFLSSQRSLSHLNLARTGIKSHLLPGIIAALSSLPVTELDLSGNDFHDLQGNLHGISSLKRLSLAGCSLSTVSLQSIWSLFPPTLTHLDLFNNPIGPSAVPDFSFLSQLTSLNLHKCQLRNFGVEQVAQSIGRCGDLKELRLGWNDITCECLTALAAVLPAGLTYLSLIENALCDDRVLQLIEAFPVTLQELDLTGTFLTTRAQKELLEKMRRLPDLQWCSLTCQTITPEVISLLPEWPVVRVNQ